VPLIVAGRCLITAYVVVILAAIFPIRYADLGWQQQVLDTFVNAGSIPLVGRIFVLLAVLYKGYDIIGLNWESDSAQTPVVATSGLLAKRKILHFIQKLQRLKNRIFRFVVVNGPTLIFVAVAILQVSVSTRTFRAIDADFLNQSSRLTQQTTLARAALAASLDATVLGQAIQALVPEADRQSVAALPPQQLRSDLLARLNKQDSNLRNQFVQQRSQRYTQLFSLTVKNVVLSLIFAYCLFWLSPAPVMSFIRSLS